MTTDNQKYEITNQAHPHYPWLHRIRALKDVREGVKAGTLGGYVQSADNLSQDGAAWIADDAICCEDALVAGDACLTEEAIAKGGALVSGDADVGGKCMIQDQAIVMSGVLKFDIQVCGEGRVLRSRVTNASPWLQGCLRIYGTVSGKVEIYGSQVILPGMTIDNPTEDLIQIKDDVVQVYPFEKDRPKSPEPFHKAKEAARSADMER